MTPEQIQNLMDIASSNGDMDHYKKLEDRLYIVERRLEAALHDLEELK